jgi:predicted enzyme related to lactoylglutathione lyase
LVTELDEEVETLKETGVTFPEDIQEIPGGQGRCIYFQDPDGNRLDFYEPPE